MTMQILSGLFRKTENKKMNTQYESSKSMYSTAEPWAEEALRNARAYEAHAMSGDKK